jgi:hypothetical protein
VPHFLTNTTLGAGVGVAVGMGVGAGVGAAVGTGVWAYSKDISADIPLGVVNDTNYVLGLIGLANPKVNRICRVSPQAQTLESAG